MVSTGVAQANILSDAKQHVQELFGPREVFPIFVIQAIRNRLQKSIRAFKSKIRIND